MTELENKLAFVSITADDGDGMMDNEEEQEPMPGDMPADADEEDDADEGMNDDGDAE